METDELKRKKKSGSCIVQLDDIIKLREEYRPRFDTDDSSTVADFRVAQVFSCIIQMVLIDGAEDEGSFHGRLRCVRYSEKDRVIDIKASNDEEELYVAHIYIEDIGIEPLGDPLKPEDIFGGEIQFHCASGLEIRLKCSLESKLLF
jgi:hypothetical protein